MMRKARLARSPESGVKITAWCAASWPAPIAAARLLSKVAAESAPVVTAVSVPVTAPGDPAHMEDVVVVIDAADVVVVRADGIGDRVVDEGLAARKRVVGDRVRAAAAGDRMIAAIKLMGEGIRARAALQHVVAAAAGDGEGAVGFRRTVEGEDVGAAERARIHLQRLAACDGGVMLVVSV